MRDMFRILSQVAHQLARARSHLMHGVGHVSAALSVLDYSFLEMWCWVRKEVSTERTSARVYHLGQKISRPSLRAGVDVQMSLAYFQAMAAQDIIGRIVGVYLPALAFEAIGKIPCLHTIWDLQCVLVCGNQNPGFPVCLFLAGSILFSVSVTRESRH